VLFPEEPIGKRQLSIKRALSRRALDLLLDLIESGCRFEFAFRKWQLKISSSQSWAWVEGYAEPPPKAYFRTASGLRNLASRPGWTA